MPTKIPFNNLHFQSNYSLKLFFSVGSSFVSQNISIPSALLSVEIYIIIRNWCKHLANQVRLRCYYCIFSKSTRTILNIHIIDRNYKNCFPFALGIISFIVHTKPPSSTSTSITLPIFKTTGISIRIILLKHFMIHETNHNLYMRKHQNSYS